MFHNLPYALILLPPTYLLCSPFFFNDPATTEIYTLSLHDALPIYRRGARPRAGAAFPASPRPDRYGRGEAGNAAPARSEEHTSELQSLTNLVCRLLLEKKKKKQKNEQI